jgi:hypothetical protein
MTAELSMRRAEWGGGSSGRSTRWENPAALMISRPLVTPRRVPAAQRTQARAATMG